MNFDSLPEIIYEIFDPKSAKSADRWVGDIARVVDEACGLSPEEFGELEIEPDDWESVYKPALLWRFYRHLSAQLALIAEGHATVLHNTLIAKKEELDGLDDPH